MIVIVDYGMGNLRSVQKGFEQVGAKAVISREPDVVAKATKLVLPGVGAFPDAITELNSRGLTQPVLDVIEAGRPFLGICLGLQLLFESGTEGGEHQGLGVLPGKVVRFDLPQGFKVPHMGWNRLELRKKSRLTAGLSDEPFMYFVHSYYAAPRDPAIVAAEAEYHRPFTAAIERDNVFACQFHPEKSQRDGLQILRNFAAL